MLARCHFNTVIALLLVVALGGCARANYAPRIEKIGKYESTRDLERRADDMSWSEAEDVEVFMGEFPAGIEVKDGTLNVAEGAGYEIVAKVNGEMKDGMLTLFGFVFYDYPEDQNGKQGLCWWQTPLSWVTLSFWTIMPTYIPCRVYESHGAHDGRRDRSIKTMRKAAKALGADILVVTGETELRQIDANSGKVVNTLPWWGATGYALRRTSKTAD